MLFIVGLGNPGQKFEKTPHNLGFQVIDEFYKKEKNLYFFSDFQYQKNFQALISKGKLNNKKIILAKPQTFMNNSGKAVKSLFRHYNLTSHGRLSCHLWVIHDDIDLPLGKIRISKGRGAGGHKGVESIIKNLETKNFVRFRIGTCPKTGKPKNVERFVIQKFKKGEEKIIREAIKKTAEAIEFSLKEGLEKAMNKFNK